MMQMTPLTKGKYRFKGNVGQRIENNLEQWLLPTPYANPKMFEMFRLRDRQPRDNQVDWAGEFAGKFLISAVQAARMTDDPRLTDTIRYVVAQLIQCQDSDGYIGPWPKNERLLAHWDLWGHYHIILGLTMWYEDTGDQAAYDCALRAADFVCNTFIGNEKMSPADAGWGLTNLGIIHVFGRLYRYTGNERYREFMRLIEKDWERGDCGNPVHRGAAGEPYYAIKYSGSYAYNGPKWEGPARWESLHQLQGMIELYRITGDSDFKTSFINFWHSIREYDVHNTGSFSTNESALGTPFTRGAIETCCQVAWQYMTEDMIALTGDSAVADEMERGFWNGTLGYQHPSGRWNTYNTPVDGNREASPHAIVFQARNGSSELNCCSVNAPRGLGMLSEWALMEDASGALVVNYYGPMEATVTLNNGSMATVIQETDYPASGRIRLTVSGVDVPVMVRIPSWTSQATVAMNGLPIEGVTPGSYQTISGSGKRVIDLDFNMTVRTWLGSEDFVDCVSIYYGPLLLTFDQKYNPYDCMELDAFDFAGITAGNLTPAIVPEGIFPPLVLFTLKTASGQTATLCDYASASVYGTNYRSWLPVSNAPPPGFRQKQPQAASTIPAGTVLFTWCGKRHDPNTTYRLLVAQDKEMKEIILTEDALKEPRYLAPDLAEGGKTYYWAVTAHTALGDATSINGPCSFQADSSMENPMNNPALRSARGDGLIVGDPLDGQAAPVYGIVLEARKVTAAPDRFGQADKAIQFNGDGMIRYGFAEWPEDALTVLFWARPDSVQKPGNVQMFSAWCRGGDDPLRILWNSTAKAYNVAIEMVQAGLNTPGGSAEPNTWFHVAVVRDGNTVRTYLNGVLTGQAVRPAPPVQTQAEDFAIGANPHHEVGEFFTGSLDDFAFYKKALNDDEITRIFKNGLTLDIK